MLTPTGSPPPPNTAADTAHSAHSTQPALRPHRATPRVEDKPPPYNHTYNNKIDLKVCAPACFNSQEKRRFSLNR